MRNYTVNWGRFLLLRWFVASWLLHGVHVFDKTERAYYIICELLIYVFFCLLINMSGVTDWWVYLLAFIIVHTVTWLVDSHWLVGYREVDKSFKGKGIGSVIEFAQLAKSNLIGYNSVDAICIYGSLCRRMYHDRSDMDLRVVQTGKSFKLFWEIQKLRFVGIWRYRIPLDLKLVDSVEYLKKEMRLDEKPIMLYKRGLTFFNEGVDFIDLVNRPNQFLKNTPPTHTAGVAL